MTQVIKPNFKKDPAGLIAVIVQDAATKEVLMLAFTDEKGFYQSLKTGKVSLYSRSRQKSWVKGEESGNFMRIVDMRVDCDADAVLCMVEPQGPGLACHANAKSCFFRSIGGNFLEAPGKDLGPDDLHPFIEAEVAEHLRDAIAAPR